MGRSGVAYLRLWSKALSECEDLKKVSQRDAKTVNVLPPNAPSHAVLCRLCSNEDHFGTIKTMSYAPFDDEQTGSL